MSEKRKAVAVVLLRIPGRPAGKIELFDSAEWEGLAPGHYRLRVDGRWLKVDGEDCLMDLKEVGGALAAGLWRLLGGALPPVRPDLPRGSLVRVPVRVIAGQTYYEKVRTASPVLRGVDGHDYVQVTLYARGTRLVRVSELEVVARAEVHNDDAAGCPAGRDLL